MTILVSPNHLESDSEYVFLAGGISNCPDWQSPVAEKIHAALPNLIIVNPRRHGWDMTRNREDSIKQIQWEHTYLKKSLIHLFWFPKETLCPITLYELGKDLGSRNPRPSLWIGTHIEYQRRLDVETQCELEGENHVWDNLDAMVDDFITAKFDFINSNQYIFD